VHNIRSFLQQGAFEPGDVLVLDNAPIHTAKACLPVILRIMTEAGVSIQFLPSYSPELNPCELVFARMKRFMQEEGSPVFDWVSAQYYIPYPTFDELLAAALDCINPPMLLRFYQLCSSSVDQRIEQNLPFLMYNLH